VKSSENNQYISISAYTAYSLLVDLSHDKQLSTSLNYKLQQLVQVSGVCRIRDQKLSNRHQPTAIH